MIYIGVDPGKKGAAAIIDEENVIVIPWDDTKFIDAMAEAMNRGKCIAAVEKVGAFSGQGVKSMFSFGQSYGFIQGVLEAFGIGYQLVPPTVWKRDFGLLNKEKRQSISVAKKLLPGINLYPTERSRVESDGMADAAILALYAMRHF